MGPVCPKRSKAGMEFFVVLSPEGETMTRANGGANCGFVEFGTREMPLVHVNIASKRLGSPRCKHYLHVVCQFQYSFDTASLGNPQLVHAVCSFGGELTWRQKKLIIMMSWRSLSWGFLI